MCCAETPGSAHSPPPPPSFCCSSLLPSSILQMPPPPAALRLQFPKLNRTYNLPEAGGDVAGIFSLVRT